MIPFPASFASRLLLPALCLGLLSSCVYYNTFFNGEKAFTKAVKMKEKRLRAQPDDTTWASAEEKLKLERAIEKGAKVIELYPEKEEYQPKSLMLIAESYYLLGEFAKAVQKYDELEKFYPSYEELAKARFHRAKSYFLNGQFSFAKDELQSVIARNPVEDYRLEAMELLAQLQTENQDPEGALVLYEKLIERLGQNPLREANIHYEIARLAFELERWKKSREHSRHATLVNLPTLLRFHMDTLGSVAYYRLEKEKEATKEVEGFRSHKLYDDWLPRLNLLLSRWYFEAGRIDEALELLEEVARLAPKTEESAKAWYQRAEHQLDVKNDEKLAKEYYDSSAAQGDFPFALISRERSQALSRLAQLRDSVKVDTLVPLKNDFMIAELFLFRLDKMDSALTRLDAIVADSVVDSVFSVRAAYARAFIHSEFSKDSRKADSLYAYVVDNYPGTDYAKQAEENLGRKVVTRTQEDKAHTAFLRAEELMFSGFGLTETVIPGFASVADSFPNTRHGAKAAFVTARLYERLYENGDSLYRDSALTAYRSIQEEHPATPFSEVAMKKLAPVSESESGRKGSAKTEEAKEGAVDTEDEVLETGEDEYYREEYLSDTPPEQPSTDEQEALEEEAEKEEVESDDREKTSPEGQEDEPVEEEQLDKSYEYDKEYDDTYY